MDTDFDIHDHRHRMKLLRDTGGLSIFENRDDVRCPACADPFERLILIERQSTSFPEHTGAPFCLVRRENDIALFRH
ncbi:DUF7385 family protein [Natrialba swarupiae]|uniref:Flagella cluster protein n=1 Tax=Natrialba swarupiae TaxID=2448032 RepID=A0A5D5ANN1_9EURY|nr:flagella cluster protein [Natrialba swarupiae]